MEEKRNTHGGRRPGAGRPRKTIKAKSRLVFRCLDKEYELISKGAEIEGKSINQYLIDAGVQKVKELLCKD